MKADNLFEQVKNERKWQSQLDYQTGKVFFFNNITKERQDEKPSDYDGDYVIGEKASVGELKYNSLDFTKRFCTPLEDP